MQISGKLKDQILNQQNTWLVTGVAGFIGSNLLETLLQLGQKVTGLDNFSTGFNENLLNVKALVGDKLWENFEFIEGDIKDPETCRRVCSKANIVLHQAALGSVPRSIKDPIATHQSNVDGFLNMLVASKDTGVKKFVYASSSSVYGDSQKLPKVESETGNVLSPYAASKLFNEIYASVFARLHDFSSIGLRYFNVFGPRQNPNGAYAAVIPRWIDAIINNRKFVIYGDGKTSRDFCYIENVITANLLSAVSETSRTGTHCVLNVGNHNTTSLNELYLIIADAVSEVYSRKTECQPEYQDFRSGDVRASLADITKAAELIDYVPVEDVKGGILKTVRWFKNTAL